MLLSYTLRDATPAEAEAASAVVQTSFLELAAADWEPAGRQVFLSESTPDVLAHKIGSAAITLAAWVEQQMVGFLLMPTPALLSLLFVHPRWLRQGIAVALWEQARTRVEAHFPEVKTVELNATPHALAFYRAMGFVPLSATFTRRGCRATRMACWLPARALDAEVSPTHRPRHPGASS